MKQKHITKDILAKQAQYRKQGWSADQLARYAKKRRETHAAIRGAK